MIMTIKQLYELACSLEKPLITDEILTSNDFYGHATSLKRYAGIPNSYSLKGSLEHGPLFAIKAWDVDLNAELPAFFCWSRQRFPHLKKQTKKAIFAVGSLINYVEPLLTMDEMVMERKRVGKNLLAFAPHGTHWIDVKYDIDGYCKFLNEIGGDFNTITICLYWKEILRGEAEAYLKHGFECVTAGHIYDPLFLPRLRTIIELSTLTTTQTMTSASCYSVMLGKPHYYHPIDTSWESMSECILQRDSLGGEVGDYFKEVFSLFTEMRDDITPRQREVFNYYFGYDDLKSPQEIRDILDATEEMYRKGPAFFKNGNLTFVGQTVDDLNINMTDIALNNLEKNRYSSSQQEKLITSSGTRILGNAIQSKSLLFDYVENDYGKVLLTPSILAHLAVSPAIWNEILSFHHLMVSDKYVDYVDAYYRENFSLFGELWNYLDIVNVLFTSAKILQPKNYLEIGVRRGRSVCVVARACPLVNIYAFDMWIQNYADMENPGPEFVRNELHKHNHQGEVTFIDGNSHETIPRFLQKFPEIQFDLITVDGDHSEEGALDDLRNVIPRLALGGVLVFDDIAHPQHPYLGWVWKRVISEFPYLASYEFTEQGFGVGFAIRKSIV